MRRIVAIVLVFAVLAGIIGANAARLDIPAIASAPAAQDGELCSEQEITNGNDPKTGIKETPPDSAGIVSPPHALDRLLYVVVVTLPPNTCVPFHSHDGAISLFVHEGDIEYAYRRIAPAASVQVRAADALGQVIGIDHDVLVPLPQGSWVTQNQEADYTYRNGGAGNAVVVLAGYVDSTNFATPTATPESELTAAAGYAAVPIVQATPGTSFEIDFGTVPGCRGGCRKR